MPGVNSRTQFRARTEHELGKTMRVDLSLNLPSEEFSVPLARHVMSAALLTAGVDPACVHEVEVALSEACTNAVKHAVDGVTYEVSITISDQHVTIEVVDSGSGFRQRHVPADGQDHWAENGRGVALIQALSDLAIFDSIDGAGGSVQMTKRLRWLDGAQQPRPDRIVEPPP